MAATRGVDLSPADGDQEDGPAMTRDQEPIEKAAAPTGMAGERIELRLYVAGQTSRSLAAIDDLRRICEPKLRRSPSR